MMEMRKDTCIVRKEFKTLDALKKEINIYITIRNRVSVPDIIGRQQNTLLLSYIHGRTALEILEEQEHIYQQRKEDVDWQIWDCLLEYLFLFYSEMNWQAHESTCLGDLNLNNFIYEEEEQVFYGVDFAHCHEGEREHDIANLVSNILMHRPEHSEYKERLAAYLIEKISKYMDIDRQKLENYRKKEIARIMLERKK